MITSVRWTGSAKISLCIKYCKGESREEGQELPWMEVMIGWSCSWGEEVDLQ